MTPNVLGFVLLAGATVVLAAIVAARLAHSAGLPALLVFLGIGLALGGSGAGIRFADTGLAQVLGLTALVLILAEGGLTTSWPHARAAAPAALLLATVGVAVSALVVAACARWLPGYSWREALLLGAILAPTDAAAVFSVLRRLPLPPRLAGMLEGESGLNDPPAVLAVTLLSQPGSHASPLLLAGQIGYQFAAGAVIGLGAGLLGAHALRRVALPASGLYPIAVLALIVASYGAAAQARASGFLAVYVSAVVLGNARLPHGPATRGFAEGVGWLAQIGLFVMLGLLASLPRLNGQILPGILIGLVLVVLARPAAVLAATVPLRLTWRERAFLSWAGLRGAVPIVLATIPVNAKVPGAARLFDVVFIVVGVFTLAQGPALPWLARRLGVASPAEPLEVIVDAAPLEELHADLLQARIPEGSRLHGVEIFELRLPPQVSLALIVRGGHGFVPGPSTVLLTGDKFLIVTPAAAREQTERRLRAVSRAGKLAGWYGEHGLLPARPPARRPPARRFPAPGRARVRLAATGRGRLAGATCQGHDRAGVPACRAAGRGSGHAGVVRRAERHGRDQPRAGQHRNRQPLPCRPPAARGPRDALAPGRRRVPGARQPPRRLRALVRERQQEQRRAGDDEAVRDVVEGAPDVDEVDHAADAARGRPVVSSQPVEQVADPAGCHQCAGDDDSDAGPAARQRPGRGAQHPEVQHVEQGPRDRAGVPCADHMTDQDVAARVDPGPRNVPPRPPLDSLVGHDHRRDQPQDQYGPGGSAPLSRGGRRPGGRRGRHGDHAASGARVCPLVKHISKR